MSRLVGLHLGLFALGAMSFMACSRRELQEHASALQPAACVPASIHLQPTDITVDSLGTLTVCFSSVLDTNSSSTCFRHFPTRGETTRVSEPPHPVRPGANFVDYCVADICQRTTPLGFSPPSADAFDRHLREQLPSDVAFGKVVLARHEGGRGDPIFVETYSLLKDGLANKRLSRWPFEATHHVDRIQVIGDDTAIISDCIDDGPFCAASLFHLSTGVVERFGAINVFRVNRPFVDGRIFNVGTDGQIASLEMATGRLHQLGVQTDLEGGIATSVTSNGGAVLALGGRSAGAVLVLSPSLALETEVHLPRCLAP